MAPSLVPAGLAAAAWCYLLGLHGGFWRSGPQARTVERGHGPPVAVVVPARDEAAHVGEALASLLAQDYRGECRIWLVDDGSGDGTGAIARGLADGPGGERLAVLEGAPRPAGWSGKLWAVDQGIAAARAWLDDRPDGAEGFLLLTDADISHAPAHLGTLVAHARAERRDLVSEMVALRCASLAERALVPAFVYFFQMLYPFSRVARSDRRTAAAAGGVVLVRVRALGAAGGIAAMRGALIDDVALSAAMKRSGARIWLGHSTLAASMRPYPGFSDMWSMISRCAYVQLGRSPLRLAACLLGMALVWIAPLALAAGAEGTARLLGAAVLLASVLSFVPTLRRYGRSPAWAPALPAIAGFYMAATTGSAIAHHRGRGLVWKGRAYREETAR